MESSNKSIHSTMRRSSGNLDLNGTAHSSLRSLTFWRRKCSELAYIWGTITMTSFDEPRANFRGHMGIDAVTGKLLPQAPRFQTHMKDPYDDYLELFVQFGYVFLFSAVYPMAAFWAFANNCLEIRTDAFKLCRIYQRPMARKVKDIGAWQVSEA
ncbi:unnamed protein product [Nesidiocoris tenuis]|uniref:Anoctamin n=1 Tax=Nesidiocoris tenuis TaxID=355587 RepID=A0A6H5G1N5_9HEMI|nr:unnamed protein product [Nesidiocoris tenuis]